MKYLITGGLGFVGNELTRQLIRQGHSVVIVDNRNRVAPSVDDLASVAVREVDITDAKATEAVFRDEKPERVVHLAAIHYIPECNKDPVRTLQVNVSGTQSVLSACAAAGVKQVTVTSSGAVYADSPLPLSEEMPIEPVDIYGVSKLMTEQLAALFHRQTGIPTVAFRLFNVFGPRETNAHIIPEVISQLRNSDVLKLGNIEPRRDFIFTEDVADGIIRLGNVTSKGLVITNLASGNHVSMRDLIELIGKIIGKKIAIETDPSRFRKADKMVQVANLERLVALTGWSPKVSLQEGLRKLLKFEGLTT
jgi:UDP-glucose 4-epimerase